MIDLGMRKSEKGSRGLIGGLSRVGELRLLAAASCICLAHSRQRTAKGYQPINLARSQSCKSHQSQ